MTGDYAEMGPEPGTFRALIERCPMVTYVWEPADRISYISPQIGEWTGLPTHLWVDDPDWWLGMIHPDDLDRVLDSPLPLNVEYRMWARDRWMWVWEHEVGDIGGGRSQGVVYDITVRKEAEIALQATQTRLGMVVDAAPVVLFATDAEGTLVLSAGKGLEAMGLAAGELVGESLFERWAHVPEIVDAARRALAGESLDNRLDLGDVTFDCEAKQAGRSACAVFRPDDQDRHAKLTLGARLRRALAEEEFELHYQPVHDLATGRARGLEALVRWRLPDGTLAAPDTFIPHAESTGLITRIGAWVVEAACRQAAAWRAQGITPLVSINASPRELRDEGYVDRLAKALARHRVPPHQLLVEVTESAMHGSDRVAAVLDDLHGLGVELAIDDFGTEYSSLGRLRELPVKVLKVDRSFMQGVPGDSQGAAIVQAVTTLAGGLDLHVVAEGIETAAQRDFAARAGCHYGQGFFWSRPLPAAEITPLLAPSRPAPRRRALRASGRSPAALPR
jgi:EAL domain-containing protein (putative c-di-GMP-specific phosphodiesterase class I)